MIAILHPRRLLLLAALACAALAAGAGAATAATLATDARCYAEGASVHTRAAGLMPDARLTVALDGTALKYRDGSWPQADGDGAFQGAFAAPSLIGGAAQAHHVIRVADGTSAASARFTVSRPAGASFAPMQGNPLTLRARFSVWGFALERGRRARAWLHWLSPRGRVRANAALGVTKGDCGTLTTARRRVFPFAAAHGRWTLVIDSQRHYDSRARGPRAKIFVTVRRVSR